MGETRNVEVVEEEEEGVEVEVVVEVVVEEDQSLGNKGKAQEKGTERTGDVPNSLLGEARADQILQPPSDLSSEEGYTTWKLLTHPPETQHPHSLSMTTIMSDTPSTSPASPFTSSFHKDFTTPLPSTF